MATSEQQALDQMSKPAVMAEVIERGVKIRALQGELIKAQLVGAVRLDVIRMLGFIANRDPAPDIEAIVPEAPEVRLAMAAQLADLAIHLRGEADKFDAFVEALKLSTTGDDEPSKEHH